MALRTPPSWLQNGSHTAENDRLTATSSIWNTAGVTDYGNMFVTPTGTPSMAVQIAAGTALIAGTQTSTQGFYIAYNDASTTISIAPSNATNPRIDLVVVTVQDAFYGGTANNQVIFQAITGTPAASPVAPSAPANSFILAQVLVGAGVTSISSGNITDKRTFAQQADLNVTATTTASTSLTVNTIASQTGKALQINNSSGAQVFGVSPSGTLTFQDGSTQTTASTYNPNITINAQTNTTYTVNVTDAQKFVTLTNSSPITVTIASNATQALPVGTQVTFAQYGAGQVNFVGASTPNPVTIVSTGATASNPKLRSQYSVCTALQISTDNWIITGDVA